MYKILCLFLLSLILTNKSQSQTLPEEINSGELLSQVIEMEDGELEEKMNLLNKIHYSDTNYYSAIYQKAILHYYEEEYDKSIEYCDQIIKENNMKYLELSYNLKGIIYDDLKEPEKALEL
jgi:tetratricopeptide (TPR) repeat protein